MALEVDVTDNGSIDNVEVSMQTITSNINEYVAEQLAETWEAIKSLAIELCPKDTGALASSIMLESEGGGSGMGGGMGGGVSGIAGGEGGAFYSDSIFAGSDDVVNPISGVPTSVYALFVHDGHMMKDGSFYEGVPFLADAVDAYQEELNNCVNDALDEMGIDEAIP